MDNEQGLWKSARIGGLGIGIATFLIAAIMMGIFPSKADLPDGYRTPIIAFEFAQTANDIPYLTGNSESSVENRQRMRAGHRWDMVFPVAYAGFMACLYLSLVGPGRRESVIAAVMTLTIVGLDVQENFALLAIVDAIEASTLYPELFATVHLATWLKWWAIGIVIGLIAISAFTRGQRILAGLGLIHVLLTLSCWGTGTRPFLAEAMALSVSTFILFAFVILIADTVRNRRQNSYQ